ncbi:MAG: hypothetical protein LBR66_09490 [Candidatus Symbiothrix sp.]|jgi:hypothetical protein|nr:hypothetical protein [Candidatus Symbiothrix sp.]
MKKVILMTVLTAVLTSSCSYYEENRMKTFSKYFTVSNADWREGADETGTYFFYSFPVSALTQTVMQEGQLNAFYVYTLDGKEIHSPLPFSDFFVDEDNYKWEEHLTVEYEAGYVTFILKPDDHHTDIDPHWSNYQFLVKFMW